MLHTGSKMSHQVKKNLGVTLRRNGVEFRVWAPFARAVAIVGSAAGGRRIDMVSEPDGYWSTTLVDAQPGQSYQFIITTPDGTELTKNDPRARVISASDNGWSVIPSPDIDWEDDQFVPPPFAEQIIYELHVGTFNRPDESTVGTFASAIERLDYLVALGITTIELMPVTSMAFSNGWGYAPNHIYSVESMLGGRHGLMEFVKACHKRGLGVILDVVYNHFYPTTDLWQFDGWSENNRGGIYFYNDARGDTPWGGRPDYGRPEVRQFILDNVTMWFSEYHLDGLRVDSTIYMRNTQGIDSDPVHDIADAWTLLTDISALAHKINPGALMIAEDCAASEMITAAPEHGGCGFDAQWGLAVPYFLRVAFGIVPDTPATIDGLARELGKYYNQAALHKVIFSDSHDTAANGSVRLSEAVAPRDPTSREAKQMAITAATIALTAPGIPMILQGEEFMQDGAFNDWQALDWDRTTKYNGIVLAYQHLIALRRNRYGNTAGLTGEQYEVFHENANDRILGYRRSAISAPESDVLVLISASRVSFDEYRIKLPGNGTWHVRSNSSWKGYSADFREHNVQQLSTDSDGFLTLPLAPYASFILSRG